MWAWEFVVFVSLQEMVWLAQKGSGRSVKGGE